MGSLRLRYEPDTHGDETGRLWFDLQTERFSGSGFFWSNFLELTDMISEMKAFPIKQKLTWTWGYNEREGDDAVMVLSLAPKGSTGELQMMTQVADLYDTSQRVVATLKLDYVALDKFRLELEALLENGAGQALLEAQ